MSAWFRRIRRRSSNRLGRLLASLLASSSANRSDKLLAKLSRSLLSMLLVSLLGLSLIGCSRGPSTIRVVTLPEVPVVAERQRLSGSLSEVAPPGILLDLAALTEQYQPQVAIASPKANQVIDEARLKVKLSLRGLSIYKDETIGLGPHLQVVLDNQPPRSVYDLDEPLVFAGLTPGTHTLRAFAAKPWGESFKNPGAYAQTSFHVFAQTGENTPDAQQPLLTYNEPSNTYGAEPVLIDFYLSNAPLHDIARQSKTDDLVDWQIRCTINGQSFTFNQWKPIYVKGLKPGQNWVQLSLVDAKGNLIPNAFNSTIHTLTYDPEQRDSLAKLVRGELPIEQVGRIADPSYEPPALPVEPAPPAESIPKPEEIVPEQEPSDLESSTQKARETPELDAADEKEAPDQETVETEEKTIDTEQTTESESQLPDNAKQPASERSNVGQTEPKPIDEPAEVEPAEVKPTEVGPVAPEQADAEPTVEQTESEQPDIEQPDIEQPNSEQLESEQPDSQQTDSEQLDSEQLESEQLDSEQLDS
ncbi:MAG: hypothetical protein AAFP07_17220, partial [Cyanobacteria bacterium J06606_4]